MVWPHMPTKNDHNYGVAVDCCIATIDEPVGSHRVNHNTSQWEDNEYDLVKRVCI